MGGKVVDSIGDTQDGISISIRDLNSKFLLQSKAKLNLLPAKDEEKGRKKWGEKKRKDAPHPMNPIPNL